MKNIALIGSTGSIGRQVLNVVRRNPDSFKICALVGGRCEEALRRQSEEFGAPYALACAEEDRALDFARMPQADIVFNAAGGFAGLNYSLAAVQAGKTLALANKETLVCGGDIIMPQAAACGVDILPVDSEHSAIWQCLAFRSDTPVRRLIITASGGAFADSPYSELKDVTPERALAHPTWRMGKKITVDSATLMNKGYEVIEAHKLYKTPYSSIETVIQPQSIIHSMVEFTDGAVIAQMSYPTMEVPVQLALSYPDRLALAVEPMKFTEAFSLGFKPLVRKNYPCFDLALSCGEEGGILPCALNAADEAAVGAFLEGRIAFTDIFRVVDGVIQDTVNEGAEGFAQLKEVDFKARSLAQKIIGKI